jgi:hypothetical protein
MQQGTMSKNKVERTPTKGENQKKNQTSANLTTVDDGHKSMPLPQWLSS